MFRCFALSLLAIFFISCEEKQERPISFEKEAVVVQVDDGLEINIPEKVVPMKIDGSKAKFVGDIPSLNKACDTGGCKQICAETKCNFACAGGNCSQTCTERAKTCVFTCLGGGCKQKCEQGKSCTFTCTGGGCVQTNIGAHKFVTRCAGGGCKEN